MRGGAVGSDVVVEGADVAVAGRGDVAQTSCTGVGDELTLA
jgi:hypothetical protein